MKGKVPDSVLKSQKYRFVKKCSSYYLIDYVLYMKRPDLMLRRIPWQEEILQILEENLDWPLCI